MLTPSILNSCRRKTKAGKKPLRFPPTLVFMCPTAHFVSGEAEKIGYPYRYRSRCQPKSYRTLNLGKTDKTDLFSLGKTDKIYYFCLGKTDKDMIKRKIDSYLEHFFEQNKKALLLTGARQIGKTFSIRRLGHEHFEHFVEINFIESPNLVSVFSKATSGQGYLSSYLHDHVHLKGAATPDQL